MTPPRTLSRRSILQGASVTALGLAAGCGVQRDLTVSGQLDQLRVVNWPEYFDLDLLASFEADTGIRLDYQETYEDNISGFETFIKPLLADPGLMPTFDVITPTNWLAARMIRAGAAEPLPLEFIPNHVNIDPVFATNDWDRGSRFQMPWQAGITGIAHDPAQTGGLTSIEDLLFRADLRGRVALIGEMREAVGFGMLANGDDPSRPTPATAAAGLATIERAVESGQITALVFDDFVDLLEAGQIAASMAWSGNAVGMIDQRPDLEFVIPDEGAIFWFDTMVIPRGAPNVRAAAAWMNWVYEPSNAVAIADWVQYVTPVLGVQAEAERNSSGLAENRFVFPDDSTRNKLITWGTMDEDAEDAIDVQFELLFDVVGAG